MFSATPRVPLVVIFAAARYSSHQLLASRPPQRTQSFRSLRTRAHREAAAHRGRLAGNAGIL